MYKLKNTVLQWRYIQLFIELLNAKTRANTA